jgi:hypothetical protein
MECDAVTKPSGQLSRHDSLLQLDLWRKGLFEIQPVKLRLEWRQHDYEQFVITALDGSAPVGGCLSIRNGGGGTECPGAVIQLEELQAQHPPHRYRRASHLPPPPPLLFLASRHR